MQGHTSIRFLLSEKECTAFEKLGLSTVQELLNYFPKRYEDRRRFDMIPAQAGGAPVCIRGTVIDSARKGFGGRGAISEAKLYAGDQAVLCSSSVTLRWFNMPYISKLIAAGQELIVYGKVKESQGRLMIDHPEFEILEEGQDSSIHIDRVVPVYKLSSGVSQRRLRELVYEVLEKVEADALVPMYDVDETYPRVDAYRDIHFPESLEVKDAARRYFALEEFFFLQLNVAWKRSHFKQQAGHVLGLKKSLLKKFYEQLPFDLTSAQKRSVKEIAADMAKPVPMNRMLQGDVGSGKTFVALCAALMAIESGVKVAMMAPTQILAEQHYLEFKKWSEQLGVEVGVSTGNLKENVEAAQIVIGTHALLFENEHLSEIGLVIVDEQHKFGVEQRSRLIQKGVHPDVLVMTATPIPRTLTLTIYGDLDVSVLDERPQGRGAMVTGLRVKPKVSDVTKFIKEQLANGRQAYIVYPLVEESETLKAQSAISEHAKWEKRFSKYGVGLLHGKLKPEQKEEVMQQFRTAELKVLVATSVIEVGVDVPNANIMVIYNAERFGLAQLHQLRGRVGRGEHKSYCILISDGKSEAGMEKLEVLAETTDGFKIAEADLKMRGPGDVLGVQQSGLSDLRFIEYLSDPELIREARSMTDKLLESDPALENHKTLRARLDSQQVLE